MANTRPIRRGRVPFRRGRRWTSSLNRRWLDGNSTRPGPGTSCGLSTIDFPSCEPDSSPYLLFYGDTDWDWADASEVRIDRILGTISWRSDQASSDGIGAGDPVPYVVRMGILAVEDTDIYPTIDLFDPENLEEYQWMWLYHSTGNHQYAVIQDIQKLWQYDNIDIDIRTRRKLGKKDSILLYKQYLMFSSVNPSGGGVGLTPQATVQLRGIIRS